MLLQTQSQHSTSIYTKTTTVLFLFSLGEQEFKVRFELPALSPLCDLETHGLVFLAEPGPIWMHSLVRQPPSWAGDPWHGAVCIAGLGVPQPHFLSMVPLLTPGAGSGPNEDIRNLWRDFSGYRASSFTLVKGHFPEEWSFSGLAACYLPCLGGVHCPRN